MKVTFADVLPLMRLHDKVRFIRASKEAHRGAVYDVMDKYLERFGKCEITEIRVMDGEIILEMD